MLTDYGEVKRSAKDRVVVATATFAPIFCPHFCFYIGFCRPQLTVVMIFMLIECLQIGMSS